MPESKNISKKKLIEKINKLKKERKAILLVHNYQLPEIYEIADFIGDSLELCRMAQNTKAKVIVFCGVKFMAESAKILNPKKTVLLPSLKARCRMAQQINIPKLKRFQKRYQRAKTVCYINTSAGVKAHSDICCTSANSLKIVNSLKAKRIIFVPDKNLANFTARHTEKEIIPYPGFCYVHSQFKVREIERLKELHPRAKIIAHPECPPEIIEISDFVCSTSQMLEKAKKEKAKEFIILTEAGMLERLKREVPEKKFYTTSPPKICYEQKEIRLENVYFSLSKMKHQVKIPQKILLKAKEALNKMIAV